MKKIMMYLVLTVIACNLNSHGTIAYRITEKDLIPEGITWSAATHSFYVSSINLKKIVRVDAATGACSDFVTPDVLEMVFLGMMVDDSQSYLWACGNITDGSEHYSSVSQFDLETGELIKCDMLSDSSNTLFNDLALDQAGNVFITNTQQNRIYLIDAQTGVLQMFLDSDEIPNPNGITISPDNKYLYVATGDQGIRIIDIAAREIINTPDPAIDTNGLDGIKFYKNSIVGVHNGDGNWYVAQYLLNDTGTQITGRRIIDEKNPLFNIPTTCVIVDDAVYWLANSQMDHMDWDTRTIINPETLVDNLILKKNLGR